MATTIPDKPVPVHAPAEEERDPGRKSTHGQVLKSSAISGGSQILNIAIGIIRTKAMAVLLGPAGFGLFGLYSSVANLAQTLAGMGVNSSGVRQIAAAIGTGDQKRISETVFVLRRVSVLLGIIGAALMALFAAPISVLTFGNRQRASAIAWLSISVFLMLVSAGQTALIQGLRRISELARIQVLGALFGTLLGVPLVCFFRERGVVPSLICVAATTILTSWWHSRKVSTSELNEFSRTGLQIWTEVGALLKLGLAFMTSGLITLGVAYAIRVTILHKIGFAATGLYQSAWTLGGLYVGFILQAMGADFYPRLTAHAGDNTECNRLVNEQAEVAILLAGPGVLASFTLAPIVIELFFSARFGAAVPILRWICFGAMWQVISWPMGYIIIAKAKRFLFIACEMAWGIVSIGLAWICIARFGLAGAGIAFLASYVFHAVMLYVIVSRLSGFRWSHSNLSVGLISMAMLAGVFSGFFFLPGGAGVALGAVATILHSVYSIRMLTSYFTAEEIPSPIRKLYGQLRMGSSS